MFSVLYRITYLPHLETDLPKYYIGSKYNYKNTDSYLGSPSSTQIFDYTDGMTLAHWWKQKIKNNKDDFIFEILEEYDNITPGDLVIKEGDLQKTLDVVLSDDFFNQGYATCGWYSRPNNKESRKKKSVATKKYWASQAGQEKRKRLVERNKKYSADRMSKMWEKHRDSIVENLKQPKSKTHKENISKGKLSNNPIKYKEEIYYGWYALEKETGISKHLYNKYYVNGILPEKYKGKNVLTNDDYKDIIYEYVRHTERSLPSSIDEAKSLLSTMKRLGIISNAAINIILENQLWK